MSNTAEAVSMHAIAYQLGEASRVSELALPEELRKQLLGPEGGLELHRVSQEGCVELAVRSARKTLEAARERGPRAEDVDALIVVSNSLDSRGGLDFIGPIVRGLELWSATTFLLNSGDCCNFQVAARMAYGLVASGQCRNVLLVTADRVADVCAGQFVAVRNAGINSDAAASCLFSRGVHAGFRVHPHFQHAVDVDLLSAQQELKDGFIKVIGMARKLVKGLYEASGVSSRQISQLITNTYTKGVAEIFGLATGVPAARVYMKNIARTAHCFAADNLINLHDYTAEARPEPGARIMLMGSGVHQWSAFFVECEGPAQAQRA